MKFDREKEKYGMHLYLFYTLYVHKITLSKTGETNTGYFILKIYDNVANSLFAYQYLNDDVNEFKIVLMFCILFFFFFNFVKTKKYSISKLNIP